MPLSGTPQLGDWLDSSITTWTSQGWTSFNRSSHAQKMVLHPDGVILYVPAAQHYCYMKANGETTWTRTSTSFYTAAAVHGLIVYDPTADILWWVGGNTGNTFLIRAYTVDFATHSITLVDAHTVSQFDGTVWPEVAFAWSHSGVSTPWLTIGGDFGSTDGMWLRSFELQSGTTIVNQGSDTVISGWDWDGQDSMFNFINSSTYGDGRQRSYYLSDQVDNEGTGAFHLFQIDSPGYSVSTCKGGSLVFNTNRMEEGTGWNSGLRDWRTSTTHDVYSQPAIWKTSGGAGRALFYCSGENEFRLSTRADFVNDTDVWTETSQGKPTGFAPSSATDCNAVHCIYDPINDKVHISIVEFNGVNYDIHFCEWSESGGFANITIDAKAGASTEGNPTSTDNVMAVRQYITGALIGVFDETTGRSYLSYIYFEGDGSVYGPVEYNLVDNLVGAGGAPSAWGVWGT